METRVTDNFDMNKVKKVGLERLQHLLYSCVNAIHQRFTISAVTGMTYHATVVKLTWYLQSQNSDMLSSKSSALGDSVSADARAPLPVCLSLCVSLSLSVCLSVSLSLSLALSLSQLQSNRHHQQSNTFKNNLSDAKTTENSNVCYHVVLLVDEPSTIKTKAVKIQHKAHPVRQYIKETASRVHSYVTIRCRKKIQTTFLDWGCKNVHNVVC